MARFLTRKLGATLRALTFQRDDVDASPYRGGYDIDVTYGRALPPSDDICYPISSTNANADQGLRPEKDDGHDRYGYGVERYGYRREAGDTKKPRSRVPEYVGEFESKPAGGSSNHEDGYGYGYGDGRRKKQEETSWGYEYGYGGRRVRYREKEKDPLGILIGYAKEDMKRKEKEKRDRKKPSYGEDLGRVYGVGGGKYRRSEDGGSGGGDGGGLFGRSTEEVYGKEGVEWGVGDGGGGGGRFRKPRFGAPDGQQGRSDIPKAGVPSWDPDVGYSYGGRRWKYDDQDDGGSSQLLGKRYGLDDVFNKKPYGEDPTDEEIWNGQRGEIRECSKFGEKGKDGYRRSKERYGYGERKRPAGHQYGRTTLGQQRLQEEEDGRWRQKLSSEFTSYNPADIIDDSEEEWMRRRDRRRARP